MAKLYPDIETINRQKVPPTNGERKLIDFLSKELDDSYEIYFQPFLNGDMPDIAVMRKGSGVLLIEVKDWDLRHYYVDNKTKWRLKENDAFIKSPLNQVNAYKENLFKLHIEELYLKSIKNKNHWATVNCAVYFHNSSSSELNSFLTNGFGGNEYNGYRKFLSYFGLWGYDTLTTSELNRWFSKFWMNRQSRYFDDNIYYSIQRFLKPPIHQIEEGKEIRYTKEQQELIRSEVRPRRKVKGVAGSGKTLVLAKRAVNAHVRTGERILILTYNLSLKNYIHDRISDVREKFDWRYFYITNYHQFFKTQANNYNLKIYGLPAWQDTNFFDAVKSTIQKYDVVLIDEVQDYQQEWIDIISKYFIHSETEFVVFGDEKQNIYDREMDENNEPIVRTVPGVWNKSLNTSHRFASNIANIAIRFQKVFFGQKYKPDEIKIMSQLDFEKRIIKYFYFKTFSAEKIVDKIYQIVSANQIHSSDIGILCSKVELIRAIDYVIRTQKHENTKTTFESTEEYNIERDKAIKELQSKGVQEPDMMYELPKILSGRLEDYRKIRKNHFWMKTGTMKLSTVHSFKGWETSSLFMLVEREEEDREFTNAELIYTGLTRARNNLFVINLNNSKYHDFFKGEIDDCELIE